MCIGWATGAPVLVQCDEIAGSIVFDFNTSSIQQGEQCLEIVGGSPKAGSALQMSACSGDLDKQTWGWDADIGRIFHCLDFECSSAFCVDLPGGDASPGNALWLWDCIDGADGQTWLLQDGMPPAPSPAPFPGNSTTAAPGPGPQPPQSMTGYFRYSADPSKCIGWETGAPVLADCNGVGDATFRFNTSTIEFNGQCLDISGGLVQSGTYLQMWECNGMPENQGWGVDEDAGRIYHCADEDCQTMFCVDLPGADASLGNALWLWECIDGAEGQLWTWENGPAPGPSPGPAPGPGPVPPTPAFLQGFVHYRAAPTLCIGFDTGAPIMTACDEVQGQVTFDIEASALVYDNQCLDISGGLVQSGTYLQLWECTGNLENQGWAMDQSSGRIFHCPDEACETPFCVDLPGGDATPGNALWLWECADGAVGQSWTIDLQPWSQTVVV